MNVIRRLYKVGKIFSLSLLTVNLLASQEVEKDFNGRVYEFPIVKGNQQEREKAYQLPDSILYEFSTEELLETCLNYPFIGLIYFFNDLPTGLSSVYNQFNGFQELINREDATETLIDKYIYLNLQIQNLDAINAQTKMQVITKCTFIQYLIRITDVKIGLTSEKVLIIIYEILKTMNYIDKEKYSTIFLFQSSLGLLVRMMEGRDFNPITTKMEDDQFRHELRYLQFSHQNTQTIIIDAHNFLNINKN